MAVAAVVLQPSESSITESWKGPKKAPCTFSSTSSPSDTSEPPTQTAIDESPGARVKKAPWTSPLHILRRHAAVAEQDVDIRVLGHDGVERARMWVGVEL